MSLSAGWHTGGTADLRCTRRPRTQSHTNGTRVEANSRLPTIVPQQASEPFVADDLTLATADFLARINDCQPSPLVVVEQNSLLAVFLPEHRILRPKILDHSLLLAIDPTSENYEQKLPGMKNEPHGTPMLKLGAESTASGER